MCLRNTVPPPTATKSLSGKNSQCPTFRPCTTPGHTMSVKCELLLGELTVQVGLLYHHPKFQCYTFNVRGTKLRTDKQKNDSKYSIQGKFRPCFIFTLWLVGELKTGLIDLYNKDYVTKLEIG